MSDKMKDRIIKISESLEDLSHSFLEQLTRIPSDDAYASYSGDIRHINEGSAQENWELIADVVAGFLKKEDIDVGDFSRWFLASKKKDVETKISADVAILPLIGVSSFGFSVKRIVDEIKKLLGFAEDDKTSMGYVGASGSIGGDRQIILSNRSEQGDTRGARAIVVSELDWTDIAYLPRKVKAVIANYIKKQGRSGADDFLKDIFGMFVKSGKNLFKEMPKLLKAYQGLKISEEDIKKKLEKVEGEGSDEYNDFIGLLTGRLMISSMVNDVINEFINRTASFDSKQNDWVKSELLVQLENRGVESEGINKFATSIDVLDKDQNPRQFLEEAINTLVEEYKVGVSIADDIKQAVEVSVFDEVD